MKWPLVKTNFWFLAPVFLAALLLVVAGCDSGTSSLHENDTLTEDSIQPSTTPVPSNSQSDKPAVDTSPTAPAEEVDPATAADLNSSPINVDQSSETVETQASVVSRFADEQVKEILEDFLNRDGPDPSLLEAVSEADDDRFVSVLLELMRARQIGLIAGNYELVIETLEKLSEQRFGGDWPAWVEWYGQTDLEPPPGFTGWKGQLLGRIDSDFADFLRDEYPSRIRPEEIMWGGVGVDGIPPLENPPMVSGVEADYLLDEEPVFGLVVNGDARAYPLRIIDNHEMANDVVGGVPVSIAYCTLCGAAVAYEGRDSDGQDITFGTSGFLYRSNKLMYDRPTRTLWNQLTGEPVLGELADSDIKLKILPIVLTTWADWLAQHPDTLVLDRNTGVYPADFYEPGVLYGGYFASEETMFPVWQRSDLLETKDFIYALYVDGVPKAYDVRALAAERVVNDTVGSTPVVLVAPGDTIIVSGNSRRDGPVNYTNGSEVRAYSRGDELFAAGAGPELLVDASGRTWQITEEALLGPDGETAPRLGGHLAYWFGWYAFFPNTELYPAPVPDPE